ncbi:hypothetical protein G9A89_020999 [Geosiphon pyriformis]|nr:hypothetical protein G9A89_020999 [Geosiphon pyriformis]
MPFGLCNAPTTFQQLMDVVYERLLWQSEQVIVYASRTLKPTELKYGSTELEATAVIWALKHFQQYLKNGKEFDIITDNIGLK